MNEQTNDKLILAQFREQFKKDYGKDLPEGINSASQLLDLFDREIQRQDEVKLRKENLLKNLGFKQIQTEPKENEVVFKEQPKDNIFDDGRLDNLNSQQITDILKKHNKFTTLTGDQIENVAKRNYIPKGFLLTMIKNEGLITDDSPNEQEKNLDIFAKSLNNNFWNKGVRNVNDLANKLNPNNKSLPNILSHIYQSLNPNI